MEVHVQFGDLHPDRQSQTHINALVMMRRKVLEKEGLTGGLPRRRASQKSKREKERETESFE
jgi:hypothetical protein